MSDYKIDTIEIESQIIAPAATTSVAGLQSASDKTKLDGVATGATANSTDAALRDRATHTGTQLSTTISDFSTAASSSAPVQSVAGKTGTVTLVKGDVGLSNVDDTSDATKNAATATLTNKSIDATNNTITNIVNSNIASSAAIAYSKLNIADGDLTIAKTTGLQTVLNTKYDASTPNLAKTDVSNTFTQSQSIDVAGASSTLNIDANNSTANPARIVFTNTSGTGDCQIIGDGGDFGLQSGGSRALQHYAYHEIVLQGGRVTGTPAAFIAGSSATYNTRILNSNDSIALSVRGAAGQTADLLQVKDISENELLTVTASGQVGIGQSTPVSSAKFEISSTTQGFLQPRMTTAQRIAIASPVEGLQVYDTDLSAVCRYSGTGWFYDFTQSSTVIQSSTSTTYANLTEFITPTLYPGNYIMDFEGTYQSTATTTGIGIRLATVTSTISFVSINWRFSQAGNGTDKYYEYSQTALADNITSTATLTTNTNYPVVGLGVFSVSVAGTVAIQFRSEVGGSSVSIRPNSILNIRKV